MAYRLNQYKYVILAAYGLFAIFMSSVAERDMLMLMNFAIIGTAVAYILLKQEKLLLVLTVVVSIFYEGIPFIHGSYIVFLLYALMIFSLLTDKKKNKVHFIILGAIGVSFVLALVPSIVNGSSIPLLLFSTLKRYGFVIVFLFALNVLQFDGKFKKRLNWLLIALLLGNFAVAFLQYLEGVRTQDFITGFLGDGTTGIFIYLFMFYLAVISGLHYEKKITTPVYAVLSLVPLVYSAIAEVKIGFVTTVLILLVYLVFIRRGYASFILLAGGTFALIWLYSLFVSIYPEHDFMNREFLEAYLVEDAYGGGDTLNRFGFKPAVDTLVFANSQNEVLFGKGLGSGNPSGTEFLQGDVFREFDFLKYSWFTMPYLYIEAGIIGSIAFLMIYVVPFLLSVREFIRRQSSLGLVLVLMGLTNLVYLPYNAGLFSYSITTVYWLYLAMLILEKDGQLPSTNERHTAELKKYLRNILDSVKNSKGVIISLVIFAVICSSLTLLVFTKPVYQATAQVLVDPNMGNGTWMDKWTLQAESMTILTFSDMIKSPLILEQVEEKLILNESVSELNEKIAIHFKNNSLVFNVIVQDKDPVMAAAIANTTANVFTETWLGLGRGHNVKMLTEAKMDVDAPPVDTGGSIKIALSVFLAAIAGIALRLLAQTIDPAVHDEEDIQKMLGTPVIGRISAIPDERKESVPRALKW